MMKDFEPPMNWTDYEDIATALYDRFGNDLTDAQIMHVADGRLLQWVRELHNFAGELHDAAEQHLGMIRNAWIDEWRNNQKPSDSNLK